METNWIERLRGLLPAHDFQSRKALWPLLCDVVERVEYYEQKGWFDEFPGLHLLMKAQHALRAEVEKNG